MLVENLYIPIRPVFVVPGVEPITRTYKSIPPTETALDGLRRCIAAFDVLNERVYRDVVRYLSIFNSYEPGYLNTHTPEHALSLAVACANQPAHYTGKDLAEWERWSAMFPSSIYEAALQ